MPRRQSKTQRKRRSIGASEWLSDAGQTIMLRASSCEYWTLKRTVRELAAHEGILKALARGPLVMDEIRDACHLRRGIASQCVRELVEVGAIERTTEGYRLAARCDHEA